MKLADFKDGAVTGVVCPQAFRDPSLLDQVKKWIKAGKLKFAEGGSDVLGDLLYLVETKSKAKAAAKSTPSPSTTISAGHVTDQRSAAEKLWDSMPEGWQKFPPKPPTLTPVASRVMNEILGGATVHLQTSDGVKEVHVSPDGALALVWWGEKASLRVSQNFRWETIEQAIQTVKPLGAK